MQWQQSKSRFKQGRLNYRPWNSSSLFVSVSAFVTLSLTGAAVCRVSFFRCNIIHIITVCDTLQWAFFMQNKNGFLCKMFIKAFLFKLSLLTEWDSLCKNGFMCNLHWNSPHGLINEVFCWSCMVFISFFNRRSLGFYLQSVPTAVQVLFQYYLYSRLRTIFYWLYNIFYFFYFIFHLTFIFFNFSFIWINKDVLLLVNNNVSV